MQSALEIARYVDRLIPYLPLDNRPRLEWPGGARLALLVVPNVEIYEYLPAPNSVKNPYPRFGSHPDLGWYTHRDYGNRVAFWRMLEVIDALRLPITVSLNVGILEHLPEIRDAIIERDWEVMSHGIYNTRYLYGISREEELHHHRLTQEIARRHLGKPIEGFLGPGFTSSIHTAELLVETGFRYSMDWFVDDQPFPIEAPNGTLVGVPYAKEINDAFSFGGHPFFAFDTEDFFAMARDQFDCLYEEGGRVMTLALHPYLVSQPYRQRHLAKALAYMAEKPGVWITTAGKVAGHFRQNGLAEWQERSRDLEGAGYAA
jgi:peptidoglycan/xylan/chitin deacetylase (PgdA/CDA1 family)